MSKVDMESALGEFFSECEEILQRVTSVLTRLESHELSSDAIDSLYRDVHTLKGTSQLFGFQRIGLIAHAIEASLEPVRQNKVKLDRQFVDLIFKSLDLIDKILKNPKLDLENDPFLQNELMHILPKMIEASNKRFGGEFQLDHSLIPSEQIGADTLGSISQQDLSETIQRSGGNSVEALQSDRPHASITKLKTEKNNQGEEQQLESSTIRIQVSLLDKLMNLVGEMVLARNQVLQFARTSDNNDFLNLTQRLDLVTTELQDNVMKTRMQPIGSVFTKFQRVVRDLGKELGKTIELVIEGSETELDKSLLEAIKDPLTHIVRNSCDHGIETAEERKKIGKHPTGIILLKAFHEGGHVIIEVRDNGRGVDPKRILAKALEKRVISSDKANELSEAEIQQLIFAPGFSTVEHVSSVSGRGVGMDVVKTNVERVGGLIDLSSQPGLGTKIKLIIPLTLAIVPAMVIRNKQDFFAIPQVKLQELIRIDLDENAKSIEKLQGQFVFRLRGDLLPLVDLHDLLSSDSKKFKRNIFNIVILKTESHSYGLVVDEICDTADIVVKPLPQFLKKNEILSGATIMGDGSVALILDTQGVAQKSGAHHIGSSKDLRSMIDVKKKNILMDKSEYLYFSLKRSGIFALPLVLVHRLEEFTASDIEVSGSEMMVKYRGTLLPLINLERYLGGSTDIQANQDSKISVIVVSKHSRYFGLVVRDILDILSSDEEIKPLLKETKGVLGNLINSDKKVITILDAFGIIDDILGIPKMTPSLKKLSHTKILFAEDTIFFARMVKKVLEDAGAEVDHFENGQLALDRLKKSESHTYSLILSDIEMPILNGYDFAKQVRGDAKFKNLPLIALTTRFNQLDQKKGMESGFNKYLEKLKSDELLQAVHELIGVK
jgi:two-component system chemotaxis sensor kinase CheA